MRPGDGCHGLKDALHLQVNQPVGASWAVGMNDYTGAGLQQPERMLSRHRASDVQKPGCCGVLLPRRPWEWEGPACLFQLLEGPSDLGAPRLVDTSLQPLFLS